MSKICIFLSVVNFDFCSGICFKFPVLKKKIYEMLCILS